MISIAFIITLQIINKNKLTDLSDIKNVLSGGNVDNSTDKPILNNPTDKPILNNSTNEPILDNFKLDPNVSDKNLNDASNAGNLINALFRDDNRLSTISSETMAPETMRPENI